MTGSDQHEIDALKTAVQTLIAKNIALIGQHDDKLAEAVKRTQQASTDSSRVVVVGETKRGKSSLVNALLRQPDLSPVDLDVATSAFLEFRPGSRVTVRAYVSGQENPEIIEPSELSDWATVLGNRSSGHPPPRSVVVESDSLILRSGIVLVDTPGVGGLDASHGDITLEALRHASALLFVVDATAEISRPEMEFLKRAAETIDLVLFALTKKDAVSDYESILAGNRERVAEKIPRLAGSPWFPVDSELARIALTAFGSGIDFDDLWAQSRIPQLQAALQFLVGSRATLLPLANGLRVSELAFQEIDSRLTQRVALADPSVDEIESLTRERQAMARQTSVRKQQINHDLDVGIRHIRHAAGDQVRHDVDQLSDEWVKRLDKKKLESSADLQEALEADAEALFIRVHAEVVSGLDLLLGEQLQSISELGNSVTVRPESQTLRETHVSSPEDVYGNTLERRVALITGVGGGLMIGRTAFATVASMIGIAAGIAAPLGLVLGFGVSHVFHRLRSQQMTKQQQRQWMLTEIGRLRTEVVATVERFLSEAQEALYPIVLQAVESLDIELQQQIAQLERVRLQDRAERQEGKRDAESARQVIKQRRIDNASLLQRIHTTKLDPTTG